MLSGENDASSFPSGGLRSTFEARGIMEWDVTSPPFIRENMGMKVLYIPTKFLSFNREALDRKTPLLRSANSINENVSKLLSVIENNDKGECIKVCVGPEQEYFLVDRNYFDERPDLRITGRTILGNLTPAGYYSDEHYFAGFSERVQSFLVELNKKLFDLGIAPCTEHQEAAPNQFEVVLNYGSCNIIADQSVILNETMQEIAGHYNLVVLFNEKPYAGVNGSGKHTNWSLENKAGENLFSPGKNGEKTLRFLLMIAIFIKALDEYNSLFRASVASYSNDLRLSEREAPPSIISLYLGEKLTSIFNSGASGILNCKIPSADTLAFTDRNRTSPVAFTGNKMEFRLTGASQHLSSPCIVINSAFSACCDEIYQKYRDKKLTDEEVAILINDIYKKHSRVVYNDNCYSKEWISESERRGLANITVTPLALKALVEEKNVKMFERVKVFSQSELESRKNIYISSYTKQIQLEAVIMVEMVRKGIMPAVREEIIREKELSEDMTSSNEIYENIKKLFEKMYEKLKYLEEGLRSCSEIDDKSISDSLVVYKVLVARMVELRKCTDLLEEYVDEKKWPYPAYDKLLARV